MQGVSLIRDLLAAVPLLTKVPEMFGAETLLMDHCRDNLKTVTAMTSNDAVPAWPIRNPSQGTKQAVSPHGRYKSAAAQKAGPNVVVEHVPLRRQSENTGAELTVRR